MNQITCACAWTGQAARKQAARYKSELGWTGLNWSDYRKEVLGRVAAPLCPPPLASLHPTLHPLLSTLSLASLPEINSNPPRPIEDSHSILPLVVTRSSHFNTSKQRPSSLLRLIRDDAMNDRAQSSASRVARRDDNKMRQLPSQGQEV